MTWFRSLCWCCCVLASSACTRDNPAFDAGSDDVADTTETTAPADESTSETTAIAECEYDPGKGLVIELPPLCPVNDITGLYESSFIVVEEASDGWLGRLCPPNDLACTNPDSCEGNPLRKLQIGPFDVSGLASTDECLTIKAARLEPDADPANCSFDAIGIWKNGEAIVIASNGDALVVQALEEAGNVGVSPVHVEDPPCDCGEGCCDAASLGDYHFSVAGEEVPPGIPTDLANLPYVFHGLAAYNPSGCAEDLEFMWAMTLRP